MKKHFFLEGPVQSGKSTLLRELLGPYMKYTGGFTSQRLIDSKGETRAFRIGAACCTSLTSTFNRNLDGIFRLSENDGTVSKFPEAFENEGVSYLKKSFGKKILLLDEIGGAELLNQTFRNTLYQTLKSGLPCIGVIKLNKSADFMASTSGYPAEVVTLNNELREKITEEYGGKIISFRRNDEAIIKELKDFLCGIFTIK